MTFGPQVSAMSARLGVPFMPWQEQVALVGGELVELDGGLLVPAYRHVVVTVERQNGKTTIVLSWLGQRALGWGSPQRVVYSAQTGLDARKKLIEDWCPILEPRKQKLGIRRVLKANGSEAIEFRNGSRVVLMGSGDIAGHGKTVDLAVKDEFFADADDRRDQALVPAMATREAAQVLTLSTAGTDESVPLRRAVDQGRQAVDSGQRSGIAYFEWSIPEDADIDDPAVWWENIPALGYTITEDVIRQARRDLPEGEFRRAFGNQWTTSDERLIPAASWDLVCSPSVSPSGRVVFAVDVNEERSAAAILAISPTREVEVVDHRPGIGWFLERISDLNVRHSYPQWAFDQSGPVGSMRSDFEALNLNLRPITGTEFCEACGAVYDDIAETRIAVRRHPSLDAAVAGARRRFVGDAWKWARKDGTVDICPLVAMTVGLYAVKQHVESRFISLDDYLDDEE